MALATFLFYFRKLVHILIEMIGIGVGVMAACNLLVYGSGNCELAAVIEAEVSRLLQVESEEVKIFARGYILENSCLALYKRFTPLKEQLGQVKKGGLYEYFYDGAEKVERQELRMESSAHKEALEECVQIGIKRMRAEVITLVLIGESNETGLFWDFTEERPSKLTYKALDEVLYKLGKRNHIKFDVIMDIPIWHGIEVPHALAKNPYIKSLFMYERQTPLHIFPVACWIQRTYLEQKNYLEVLYKYFTGYYVTLDQEKWKECMDSWRRYWDSPDHIMWRQFYENYKAVVLYTNPEKPTQYAKLYFRQQYIPEQRETISEQELQDYLVEMYHTTFDDKNIKLWLTDFKTCVDYYKL